MKVSIFVVALIFCNLANAEWVNGYIKRDGTYVQGYHRSDSDGSIYNNYSTKGNVNPYTGQQGYNDPYKIQKNNVNLYGTYDDN